MQTVAQDEGRQNRDDTIGSEAKAAEVDTARVLQLAAQRARELAEREATLRNIEVAAESATAAEKRNGGFLVKGLIFASIIAVILLRLGYVIGGETENERRALQPRSVGVTPRTTARAEIDQESSQEMATQARGLEQPAVETTEETKRPTLPKIESSKQEPLKKGVQPPPIESDTTIKPREPRKAQAVETDERFERAEACQKQGDHLCVIQLLSNRIRSEKERRLLAEAYRSVEEKQRALEKAEQYQRISSPENSWESPPGKPMSRRSTSGIPDNPYPE